jgi:hypothetical protein
LVPPGVGSSMIDNSRENNQLESSDMIRLFEIMEKFGDRIKFIENQLFVKRKLMEKFKNP